MIKKINRNTYWSETFVNELAGLGVKYACISPGSRNTPLTIALAKNKNIKSYVHIDERCSGFFALGLAKQSGTPVVVVTTSGTAVAELYPAVIEAYQQRVPLIVCSADRPPELLDCGANQTINQENLFKNHIRWFNNAGLPELSPRRIVHIRSIARRAYLESSIRSKGPVHINFPFRKPFEPDAFTDEIDLVHLKNTAGKESVKNLSFIKDNVKDFQNGKWIAQITKYISAFNKGLIIAGPENYGPEFKKNCLLLSEITGYPVFADGASQLRFGKGNKDNVISNFDAILRSDYFANNYQLDFILHFGRTPTSKGLELFLENCNAKRYMINEFGDWFDPANRSVASFPVRPHLFCEKLIESLKKNHFRKKSTEWINKFREADRIARNLKRKIIEAGKFPSEAAIVSALVKSLPEKINLMISNSMPIRDFDYFASKCDKDITIYNNRGASGIDGIISTVLGIAVESGRKTVLFTGDMAFYYDINGLLAAKKYDIPVVIILVNNNGGGIFEVLPIASHRNVFNEYFKAPHNLNFADIVKAFGGNFKSVKSWTDLITSVKASFNKKSFSVIEIKTDSAASLTTRKHYWNEVDKALQKNITASG